MAAAPPNQATTSNLLSTQRALLDTLTSFLTVATHHILFLRKLYPPVSFLSTRAYNYPVRQNRHPDVCTWINDAIAAIRDQLEKNTVENVTLCIFECNTNQVLERWTFDLHSLPVVTKRDRDVPFASSNTDSSDDIDLSRKINVTDLEATFRATLARISTAATKLRNLPEGDNAPECSFTMTIEVKDRADRPVGRLEERERQWIAAEPEPFPKPNDKGKNKESANDTGKTHPVRRLEAGELRLEVWVEESAVKFSFPTSQKTPAERAAAASYGAGKEKFNPELGYDLEEPDVNRKPGGGIGADYRIG